MKTLLIFTLTLLCSGCLEDTAVTPINTINPDSVEYYGVAAANNAFAFDMYSKLVQLESREKNNILFSPYSVSAAMAICYEGTEGTAKEQISNVFYFPANNTVFKVRLKETNDKVYSGSDGYELENANAIWVQEEYPVKEEYIFNVKNYYRSEVTNLDFVEKPDESRDAINEWVEDKTDRKIKDIVPKGSITDDTRLILTNAIYFNGKWEHEFDKKMTSKKTFYPTKREEVSVDMMYISSNFNYSENLKAKIIELPYKGNDLSMYIVLPKGNNITEFENNFTVNEYTELKYNMESLGDVETSIPKFKFETKTELSDSLIEMGVADAFDLKLANFSGISEIRLLISRMIHQDFIDVQEEVTEAAASTTVFIGSVSSSKSKSREFKADLPFIFFIEDRRTDCILFMGKVEYPEYEGTGRFWSLPWNK
uniref:Uncharacterized serpin-like protein MA_2613/MA_2612 n=2 Tax=Methanosarcina acetivorans TaxID=2214 RepID=Y2613_METAC|nr:RecName: Full=Uncharacterized serpin-like protein MA_2613/MA_2612 [Methanosarcina acetivorans C2A]